MAELTERVRRGLEEVRRRIRTAGGDPDQVRIVAVTKGFGPEAVEAAREAGCTDFGENYPNELLSKAAALDGARVHFLGAVQRRQVASIAPVVDLWHSVDREEEGVAIAAASPGTRVLVQVNIDEPGEVFNRSGLPRGEVPSLIERLRELDLKVSGLMAVGPRPPADPGPGFREVAAAARQMGVPEVSMGMSQDLDVAVAAGSTMVRVGRALFGERPPRKAG